MRITLVFGILAAAFAAAQETPGRFFNPATAAPSARSSRQAHVEIDETTRSLIITTDPTTNEQIRAVLEALDKPVPQALIQVLFLEVTHDDDLDVGLDARYNYDGSGRTILSALFGVAAETRGGIVALQQKDLEVTLRALATIGRLNVLSRPSILTRNGQQATITVGQEVPFIRNSRVTTDGQIINTVEYEDIGIILTVTPQIRENGLIELTVNPEISTLTSDTVPISDTVNAVVFAKRSAQTQVVVPSGQTVIIGGLIEDQDSETTRKVPVLGDIPLLGRLFQRKITSKSKTELLIFLTPTVVNGDDGLARMTEAEQNRATNIQQNIPAATLERYLSPPPTAAPTESD